jgi:hypothetical protein
MKYIHFLCLQKWLKSKVITRSPASETCITYSLKQIECELCKALLPDFIKYKDKLYEIWEFKPKFKSYMTFESIVSDKYNNRTLFIVNLESKQNIRIGRGHDSDIRVTDISVSRFHSIIKRNRDGSFTVEDNNSKFGTLVLLQNPRLSLLQDFTLPLQIGRTFLTFNVKRPWRLFSCFSSPDKKKVKGLDYQVLNSQKIDLETLNIVKIQNDDTIEEEEEDNVKEGDIIMKVDGENLENIFKIIENDNENDDNDNIDNIYHADNEDIVINYVGNNNPRYHIEKAKTNDLLSSKNTLDMKSIKEKVLRNLESLRRVFII